MRSIHRNSSRRGFTLFELLIVITLIGIMSTLFAPNFLRLVQRSKLTGMAQQTENLMRMARQYAIRHNVPAVVRADLTGEQVIAFVDVDGPNLGTPSDLIFNPVAGQPHRATDFELARYILPSAVYFDAPAADPFGDGAISGFLPAVAGENVAVFRPDGSADSAGAFRFADAFGNYLEVRVDPPITGRVRIRKFDDVDVAWYIRNETDKPWKWK
jgi:prepilin-type N-terminal cleavage/methylation domain-containing protein